MLQDIANDHQYLQIKQIASDATSLQHIEPHLTTTSHNGTRTSVNGPIENLVTDTSHLICNMEMVANTAGSWQPQRIPLVACDD